MKTTGYNSIKSWAIAVACSFVNCMVCIPIKISAMLFVAFPSRYDTDRQNSILFMIITGILKCLLGPFVGFLGELFELSSLAVVGCLFASLGVGICFLAEDIIFVTISLGIIYGIGFTLGHTFIPQILKQHFTKNLTNAYGVSSAGTCLTIFAIIPVISILLDNYGVSGGLLLTSGIMLHGIPIAFLLRNPKYRTVKVETKYIKIQNDFIEISKEEDCSILESSNADNLVPNKDKSKVIAIDDCDNIYNVCITEECQKNNNLVLDNINCKNEVIENDGQQMKDSKTISTVLDTCKIEVIGKDGQQMKDSNAMCRDIDTCKSESIENDGQKIIYYKTMSTNVKGNIELKLSCNANTQNSYSERSHGKYRKALKTMTILKDPSFLVIMFCQSAQSYIYMIVSTIIIDLSRDKGVHQSQEQFFLMLIPVAETVGHIGLAWVTDKGFLKIANYVAADFLCMGLACWALVLSNSFGTILAAVLTFGVFSSAVFSAIPSLVYELIEEEKQSMALSSRFVLFTPLSFTMAPVIGHFRGTLGSYNGALYLLTAFSIGCAALLLFLPRISRCTKRQKQPIGKINIEETR